MASPAQIFSDSGGKRRGFVVTFCDQRAGTLKIVMIDVMDRGRLVHFLNQGRPNGIDATTRP